MDVFKVVCKRRSRKKKNTDEYDETSPLYLEKAERKLRNVKDMIGDTLQYIGFIKSIATSLTYLSEQKIEEIVCYGLGNFTKSPNSLYQYAMVLELSEFYDCPLHIFDPVFTQTEKQILHTMKSHLISFNEEGKRSVSKTTMFFLPHCPRDLFNNIIWANWGLHLSYCVIIGNNLKTVIDSTPSRFLKIAQPYLYDAFELAEVIEIENTFHYSDVFNDMAIHVFPNGKLPENENIDQVCSVQDCK